MRVGGVLVDYDDNNTPSGSETERADAMISRGMGVRTAAAAGMHGRGHLRSSTT